MTQSKPHDSAIETANSASIAALVENAKRLGLTWDLRPATVISTNPSKLAVTVDGDDAAVSAVSMIGTVGIGDRVFVLLVPPGGVFIVGVTGPGRGIIARGVRTTNFTVTTTELGCQRLDGVALLGGHTYRISTSTLNWLPGLANQAVNVGIRINLTGSATTSSTEIGLATIEATSTLAPRQGVVATCDYTPGSDQTASVLLSFIVIAGGGTGTIFGASTGPICLYVEDCGVVRSTAINL